MSVLLLLPQQRRLAQPGNLGLLLGGFGALVPFPGLSGGPYDAGSSPVGPSLDLAGAFGQASQTFDGVLENTVPQPTAVAGGLYVAGRDADDLLRRLERREERDQRIALVLLLCT